MGDQKQRLSDEQVDLLNSHPEVLEARQRYLRRLSEGIKAQDIVIIEEAHSVLLPEYKRLHAARLDWVLENPPEPRAKPLVRQGFARHA